MGTRLSFYRLAFALPLLGGFIFGYNVEAMAGALLFIRKVFALNEGSAESLVSIALWLALIGAVSAGSLADYFGRKPITILSAILCFAGSILSFAEHQFWDLDLGRAILGLGLGLNTVVIGLYTCEIAPHKKRGSLLAIYPWAMTVGALSADGIDVLFSYSAEWGVMLGLGAIPAFLQIIFVSGLTESPIFNALHLTRPKELREKDTEEERTFDPEAKSVINPLSQREITKQPFWIDVWENKTVRLSLVIAICLAVIQQATGIVAINYFAPVIFKTAGFLTETTALWATTLTNVLSVLVTMSVIGLIERLGRRPMLLIGLVGMAVTMLSAAISFQILNVHHLMPWAVLFSLVLFNIAYDFSIGSLAWVLIPEVLPDSVRAKGVAFALFFNWLSQAFIAQIFLSLTSWFHYSGAFFGFAVLCLLSFLFSKRYVK